jgi:phosphate butyryltransferase
METIKSFEDMVIHLAQRNDRKRVAVVWAADRNSQVSVARALEIGFIEAIFVGCQAEVEANESIMRYASHVSFIPADDRDEAARISVKLVRDGGADILMKGLINTDNLLHVVLNKEKGILPKGRVLTHITAAKLAEYDKLLFFTDSAVIPYPTQEQRVEQVRYIADLCHKMGIDEPRIALNHCTEKVNEKYFPFTVGYQDIKEMARQGEFGRCIVDGPLDLKTSISPESLRIKGIDSPLGGESDAIVFPDIEAGNAFYKTITFFHSDTAGMLVGPIVPVVLPSRADSKRCKFNSLALAAMFAK